MVAKHDDAIDKLGIFGGIVRRKLSVDFTEHNVQSTDDRYDVGEHATHTYMT